jgi:chromosome segregation ATPase
MYLKRLTMKGFKSFERPVELDFAPGISVIVGPNGSGKSNIVDALLWGMGEQAGSILRTRDMHDLIFSGSQTRSALGRTEVEILIDNADSTLDIDFSEVAIRRVLFQSGASEYFINNQPVRLLDIQELLSDFNLGKTMHTVVGQGQLDQILNAGADARREFIEEASGILKYRQRKDRALRKLEQMEPNLIRIEDLLNELSRQSVQLSKQAKITQNAQAIERELFTTSARLLADDFFRYQNLLAKERAKIQRLNQQIQHWQSANTRTETEIETLKVQISASDPQLQSLTLAYHELRALRERYLGYVNLLTERINYFETSARVPQSLSPEFQGQVRVFDAKVYVANTDSVAELLADQEPEWLIFSAESGQFFASLERVLQNVMGIASPEGTDSDTKMAAGLSRWINYLPELKLAVEQMQTVLAQLDQSISEAERLRQQNFQEITEHNSQIQRLVAESKTQLSQINQAKDQLHDVELASQGIQFNFDQLQQNMLTLNLTEQDLSEKYHPAQPIEVLDLRTGKSKLETFDREILQARLKRLQGQLVKLGKVNPLALEEFQALTDRREFLQTQLEDLRQTRTSLLDLVSEVDAKVVEIFQPAFADTQTVFEQIVGRLFPGGRGKMFLSDTKDWLNSGVELQVQPAGKRVKHLSLLSGGERTLTALALMLAIFIARPSPFYVLDEVEAPLDEANLNRLLEIFQELAGDSQLILITHQKPTMVIADVLYGISMNSAGISRVISHKFSTD